MPGQLFQQIRVKTQKLLQLRDGGRHIGQQRVTLHQADIGLQMVVGEIFQRSGKKMLRHCGKQFNMNFRTALPQRFQRGDGAGGMAKTMRGDKAGKTVYHMGLVQVRGWGEYKKLNSMPDSYTICAGMARKFPQMREG